MSPSSFNPFHHSKPTPATTETEPQATEPRRSSLVGFMKKVVRAGEHEGDYRRSVEENERGRKGSQEHEDAANPEAVAAARAAVAEHTEENLHEEEPHRRHSLSEEIKEGLKLVKKQEGREKVAVALS
jgi:hypothetical protein